MASVRARIKGQEIAIVATAGGNVVDSFDAIMNFNEEYQAEIKTQGYLGETNNRKDDVYNGEKFDMEVHLSTQNFYKFRDLVKARQTRQQPDLVFNISVQFQFPNGDSPVLTITDIKFGAMPTNVSGRTEYVKVKIDGEADDYDVLYS